MSEHPLQLVAVLAVALVLAGELVLWAILVPDPPPLRPGERALAMDTVAHMPGVGGQLGVSVSDGASMEERIAAAVTRALREAGCR